MEVFFTQRRMTFYYDIVSFMIFYLRSVHLWLAIYHRLALFIFLRDLIPLHRFLMIIFISCLS